jgi:hypothetical protein
MTQPLCSLALNCELMPFVSESGVELLTSPASPRAAALAALEKSPMQMDRALEELIRLHG